MSERNYHRFYALFGKLAYDGDRNDLKEQLVSQCTNGRTVHLHEMKMGEYEVLCQCVERLTGLKERLRKERSSSLKLMQKLGIDTTDWTRVNAFCQDARIAGKLFARISIEEHVALQRKLRSIEHHGGLKPKENNHSGKSEETVTKIVMLPLPQVVGES